VEVGVSEESSEMRKSLETFKEEVHEASELLKRLMPEELEEFLGKSGRSASASTGANDSSLPLD